LRHPEIPFVCNNFSTGYDTYDGASFSDCPIRQGWATNDDPYAWCNSSLETVLVRAQSWLYFGLLSKFLDYQVIKEDFTEPSEVGDGTRIDSLTIPYLLSTRLKSVSVFGYRYSLFGISKTSTAAFEEAVSCLSCASRHSEVLDAQTGVLGEELALIAVSIKLLIDLLARISHEYLRCKRYSSLQGWLTSPVPLSQCWASGTQIRT
jgi:hypothetical protein